MHTVSIDNFLKEKKADQIRFIKIDTEGHELKVLRGCLETLKSNPLIIILFENSSPEELLELFRSINFKVFSIDKNGVIFSDKASILNAYNLFAVGCKHPLFENVH